VTEEAEPEEMLEWLRSWADDFILPPLSAGNVLPRVCRLLEAARGDDEELYQPLREKLGMRHLVGQSPAFVAEISKIPLVAKCDARILIKGETGTGKELCARAIHYLSPRRVKPFVPVNCGALPTELLENELFGHERGAYTGAATSSPGLIHLVEGGTLFLDEIDCLPPAAQVKLLRFLQEKEYRQLGSARSRRADVRVISATNVDVERAVAEGKLRRDFYYRLNIVSLLLPPLRERRDDIELLARHFFVKYAAEAGRELNGVSPRALRKLSEYDWPGNVRELEHVVERALALTERDEIRAEDINLPGASAAPSPDSFRQAKARAVEQFEKQYIREMLTACQGNITRAAQVAKKDRRAFWQLIQKHHIDVREFKTATLAH